MVDVADDFVKLKPPGLLGQGGGRALLGLRQVMAEKRYLGLGIIAGFQAGRAELVEGGLGWVEIPPPQLLFARRPPLGIALSLDCPHCALVLTAQGEPQVVIYVAFERSMPQRSLQVAHRGIVIAQGQIGASQRMLGKCCLTWRQSRQLSFNPADAADYDFLLPAHVVQGEHID